jgi:hypothetical protein
MINGVLANLTDMMDTEYLVIDDSLNEIEGSPS